MADAERASASIANSRMHSTANAAGFRPVFQALHVWESEAHSRLISAFGIALETVQFVSFALCPYFMYDYPVVNELVQVVWASIGPLWYRDFGPFAYAFYAIPFFAAAAMVFATITLFSLLSLKKIESTNINATTATRYMAESISGWLLIPILHLFLGGMNCQDGSLINFPDQSCWVPIHVAMLIVGILSIIGAVAIAFTVSASLCDTNPTSTRLKSRSHNYVELAALAVKIVFVIFFHILVERGVLGSYNIIVTIGSVFLLAVHAIVLPFYHHDMNSIRCMTYTSTAFVAIVNCITAFSSPWFHGFHVNSFILAALLPYAAYSGYVISKIRPNPGLAFMIDSLLKLASVPKHTARFPFHKGVMSNDTKMVPSKLRSLEADIINEHSEAGRPGSRGGAVTAKSNSNENEEGPSWDEIVVTCSEVLVPYIEDVLLPTDAEVANRFVHAHGDVTNLPPSANALAFAIRIHMKSIVRFKRSGIARFQFANFLFVFANRLNLALDLLNDIDHQIHDEHDALVLYSSYKVGVKVKELFGIRDNAHLHTFQRARQYHKDALTDMSAFWAKLLESKGDVVGLALLTNQLTERRQNALDEYERALTNQKGDRQLLSTFASFLEHVMCDEPGAELYRQMADEVAEEKKNRIMRGSKSKSDVAGGGHMNAAAKAVLEEDDDEEDDKAGSSVSLLRVIVILLSLVALCSGAIFVMQEIRIADTSLRLRAIRDAGSTRSYAEEAILHSVLANNAWIAAGCSNTTCKDSKFRETLYNASMADVNMRVAHNKATYGGDFAGSSSNAIVYASSLDQGRSFMQLGTLWIGSIFRNFNRAAAAAFSSLLQEGSMVEETVEPWINVHTIATSVTDLVNNMYEGIDYSRPFLYLTSNRASESLYSLGILAQHHITDISDESSSLKTGVVVAFVVAIAMLAGCYVAFYVNLRSVGYSKVTTLKLFTLIPYPTQEMLQIAAANKIEQFEKMSAEDEKDIGGGGHSHEDEDLLPDESQQQPTPPTAIEQGSFQGSMRRQSQRLAAAAAAAAGGGGRGLEDDVRRMSRFFGATRVTSVGHHNFFPSILKNPSRPKGVKSKKRVQFKIEGEVHQASKKLREPKVRLTSTPKDLVMDLERSLKDVDRLNAQENQLAKQRKDQETEKMIYGGLRNQQAHMKRGSHNQYDAAEEMKSLSEMFLRPLVAVLMIGTVVVLIVAVMNVSSIQSTIDEAVLTSSTLQDSIVQYMRAEVNALAFVNFGRSEYYSAFFDYVSTTTGYASARRIFNEGLNPVDPDSVGPVQVTTDNLEVSLNGLVNQMSLAVRALFALGYADIASVPTLAMFNTNDRTVTPDFLVKYPKQIVYPDDYIFKGTINTSAVAGLSATDLHNIALFRMSSLKLQTDSQSSTDQLRKLTLAMQNNFVARLDSLIASEQLLELVGLALSAAAAVAALLKIAIAIKQFLDSDREIFPKEVIVFAMLLIFAIITLALSASSQSSAPDARNSFVKRLAVMNNVSAHREKFFERHRFNFQRYMTTQSPLTLYELNANYSASSIAAMYSGLRSQLNSVDFSNLDKVASSLTTADLFFLHMQQVGLWLRNASAQKAAGQPVAPPSSSFLSTYDYTQELGSATDTILYSSDGAYQYSTPAVDSQRSASDLAIMARLALTGRRAYARFFTVFDSLNTDVVSQLLSDMSDTSANLSTSHRVKITVGVAFAAVACAMATVLTFHSAISAALEALFTTNKLVLALMESLFVSTLRICQISLGTLSCVLIAQFILALITVDMGEQAGSIIKTARDREYLALKSLTMALKVDATATVSDGFELSQQMALLSSLRKQLSDARNALYFADSATSTAFGKVSSLSSNQRALTFQGGALSLDNQYLTWLANLDALVSVTTSLTTVPNSVNSLADRYILSNATIAAMTAIVVTLQSSYHPLIIAIRASNDQYDSDVTTALTNSIAPDVILFAAVVIFAVLQLYFIFVPVSEQLRNEERGTRLLLSMIPQNVRDAVPKITMYLESGLLVEEEEERQIYTRCPKAAQFLSLWGHVDDQRACFDLLNESSIGQILIDSKGIVMFANNKIPALLGYDDLEGHNISILLDEPLRSLHDGFLKRFVTQGTSRVIGSGRDAVALSKAGERVHLYLNLDEAINFEGVQFFLGGLEKYSMEDVKTGRKKHNGVAGGDTSLDINGASRSVRLEKGGVIP